MGVSGGLLTQCQEKDWTCQFYFETRQTVATAAAATVAVNAQLADEIMVISTISLIATVAHAPVLSNLINTKHAQ